MKYNLIQLLRNKNTLYLLLYLAVGLENPKLWKHEVVSKSTEVFLDDIIGIDILKHIMKLDTAVEAKTFVLKVIQL